MIFVKMDQKMRSMILKFLNGFMELFYLIELSRNFVLDWYVLVRNRLEENWVFESKVVLSTFVK